MKQKEIQLAKLKKELERVIRKQTALTQIHKELCLAIIRIQNETER